MNVSGLLRTKSAEVVKVRLDDSISDVLHVLSSYAIGAVPITNSHDEVLGIISERDIVRGLAHQGTQLLGMKASELMTTPVVFCTPSSTLQQVMRTMTDKRLRHLPVINDGKLSGIISIGDVVKNMLDEMRLETDMLREQITLTRLTRVPH